MTVISDTYWLSSLRTACEGGGGGEGGGVGGEGKIREMKDGGGGGRSFRAI